MPSYPRYGTPPVVRFAVTGRNSPSACISGSIASRSRSANAANIRRTTSTLGSATGASIAHAPLDPARPGIQGWTRTDATGAYARASTQLRAEDCARTRGRRRAAHTGRGARHERRPRHGARGYGGGGARAGGTADDRPVRADLPGPVRG